MKLARIPLVVLGGILALGAAWALLPARTSPIRNAANGIAVLESVQIGGMEQWLLIRGEDSRRPVLLWLHGGPGSSQMPVHEVTSELERVFVVVHWDQRGAGKSNPIGFDESTMTMERFLADAHEVTRYLQLRLRADRILLLGHSWGTVLGLRLAAAHPNDYFGFIGVSQVVGAAHAHPVMLDWLRAQIRERELEDLRADVAALDVADLADHETYVEVVGLLERLGGGMNVTFSELAITVLAAPEYTPVDYVRWFIGANRGSGPMWPDYITLDAYSDVPRVEVPIAFLSGRADYNTPLSVTERYYKDLDAPRGKELVVFEASGHAPFFTEPDSFAKVVTEIGLRFSAATEE